MEDSKSEPGTSEDQTLKSIYKVCIMTISSFINLFRIVILIYFFCLFFCHFVFWCTLYQTPDGITYSLIIFTGLYILFLRKAK